MSPDFVAAPASEDAAAAEDARSPGPQLHRLTEALASCTDDEERRALQNELATATLGLADALARRFAGRGVPLEDLTQVARLALVRASRSFDPCRGSEFVAYAVPSVRGAIKRHFRDEGWTVRPPRRVQEARMTMLHARQDLTQLLGREPTVAEMARHIGVDEETVIEALAVDTCYSPDSLDRPLGRDSPRETSGVGVTVGEEDPGFTASENLTVLGAAIRRLPERDRLVLELRLFQGLSQSDVGRAIGVSQMQVSRILRRLLDHLQRELDARPA